MKMEKHINMSAVSFRYLILAAYPWLQSGLRKLALSSLRNKPKLNCLKLNKNQMRQNTRWTNIKIMNVILGGKIMMLLLWVVTRC